MTRDDAIKILRILKTNYANAYKQYSESEAKELVDLWAMMFDTEPVEVVLQAVKHYIKTVNSPFPPAIGEINAIIENMICNETDVEIWAQVVKAMSNVSTTDSFYSLPERIQRAIGNYAQLRQWGLMEKDTVENFVKKSFLGNYHSTKKVDECRVLAPTQDNIRNFNTELQRRIGGVK